jgi:hypothetical protein
MYTFCRAERSRKNLLEIKFFTSDKKSFLWDRQTAFFLLPGLLIAPITAFCYDPGLTSVEHNRHFE